MLKLFVYIGLLNVILTQRSEAGALTGQSCTKKLLEMAGRAGDTPAQYTIPSHNQDSVFLEYLVSLIYVESRFNRMAISGKGARGVMQITPIAVAEAALYCKLPRNPKDIHDVSTNIQYGSCYLMKMLEDAGGDWTKALILYNGGYRSLTRYEKGDSVNLETANYTLQVHRVRQLCGGK